MLTRSQDDKLIEELVSKNKELQERVDALQSAKEAEDRVRDLESSERKEIPQTAQGEPEKKSELGATIKAGGEKHEDNAGLLAEMEKLKGDNKALDQLLTDQEDKTKAMEADLKKFLSQVVVLQENIKKLQQDYSALSGKFTEKTRELEKSEEDKALLEKALLDSRSLIEKANELGTQTQFFLDKITEAEEEKLELKKKVAELEDKLAASEEAMGYFSDKLPLLTSAVGRFQDQIHSLQTENEALKKGGKEEARGDSSEGMAKLQEELHRTRAEGEDNRKHAESLKSELESREKETKALRHKLNEYERLKGKANNEPVCNEERCMLQGRRYSSKEVRVTKSREEILRKQIEQLKSLVENYEDSNKQLIEYINSSTKLPFKDVSENQVEDLRSELRMKENDLILARLDNGKLKSEMNILRLELGEKTAECESGKAQMIKLREENSQLHGKLGEANQDEASVNSQILGRENEIVNLRDSLKIASEELELTRDILVNKSKECEHLRAQLIATSKEGMSGNNDELMQSYKVVCDSNQRQKEEMEALMSDNRSLLDRVQQLNKQVAEQNLRVATLEDNNKRMLAELETQTTQMKGLIKELQEAYEFIQTVDEEKNGQAEEFKKIQSVL